MKCPCTLQTCNAKYLIVSENAEKEYWVVVGLSSIDPDTKIGVPMKWYWGFCAINEDETIPITEEEEVRLLLGLI